MKSGPTITPSIKYTSVETKYYRERQSLFEDLQRLDRRAFMKVSLAAVGAALAHSVRFHPFSFQPVRVAQAAGIEPFRFAYISDSHLYERKLNDRFVRALFRAVSGERTGTRR
jgi:Icc protein